MRQNPTNIFKFMVMLTGFFSATRVLGQTILPSGSQAALDNRKSYLDSANSYRQQIDSATKKIIDYVGDHEGFPKIIPEYGGASLREFVPTVIPDFRQESGIISRLYSYIQVIGTGAAGTIIKATRRENGEDIAVKLMLVRDSDDSPAKKYYREQMSGLAKSALLQDKNITDLYPKLIGVYLGPCKILSKCLEANEDTFIIYTEMTLINAIAPQGQYCTDNIAFESLWNKFCSIYVGKFTIGDPTYQNFVLAEVSYDRAYHVSYKGKENIFLFPKEYPVITRVDLDVEHIERDLTKIFSINYPPIMVFDPSGDGYRLLQSIKIARENEQNDGRTIFDFLLEHFAKYIVSEDALPQDNIRHFSIPEKFMTLITGDNTEVMQEKEL